MTVEPVKGRVMTVMGPVAPEQLGAVLMHEHVHLDVAVEREGPTPPERVELLQRYCVPHLKQLPAYGCRTVVESTPMPMRAEPWVYQELARTSSVHIVMATGFYREAAPGEGRFSGRGFPHRWLDARVLERN